MNMMSKTQSSLYVLVLWACVSLCGAVSTVSMQDATLTVTEGDDVEVCVVATLDTDSTVDVTVNSDASSDFTLPMTSLSFPAGDGVQTRCLTLTAVDDNVYETDSEDFTLSLSIASPSTDVSLVNPMTTVVSIVDTDEVTVGMRDDEVQIMTEGGSMQVCAIITAGVLERAVVVQLATTNSETRQAEPGDDYVTVEQTFMFSPGGSSTSCLNVQTMDDQVYEYKEQFDVTLSVMNHVSNPRVILGRERTSVFIIDDERVGVSMRDPSITQMEADGNVEVCAQLASPTGGTEKAVLVRLTSSMTSRSPEDLTFPSGSMDGDTECLTLNVEDNSIFENSPIVSETVTLSKLDGQGRVDVSGSTTTVRVNDDDDVTIMLQTPSNDLARNEGERDVMVCAMLTGPSGGLQNEVMVEFDVSGQSSVTGSFASGASHMTTRCVDINIDNNVYETDTRQLTVSLSSSQQRVTTTGSFTLSITDDDDVTIILQTPSNLIRNEGERVMVCAMLTGPGGGLQSQVTVAFAVSGQSSVTRSFPSGASPILMPTQCINIDIPDNNLYETDNRQLTVSLSSSQLRVTATGSFMFSITDDDDVVITLQTPSNLNRNEREGTAEICAMLTGPSGGLLTGVTFQFNVNGQSTRTGSFPSSALPNSIASQCVNINIDNEVYEANNRQLRVSLSSSDSRVITTGSFTLSITDNDVVTIILQIPTNRARNEGDSVEVCAMLTGPTGGLQSSVTVEFDVTGQGSVTGTFPLGASPNSMASKCVLINVDNNVYEADTRQLTVSLSSSQQRVTATGSFPLTITDNDDVTVYLVNSTVVQTESVSDIRVCARLTSPTGGLRRAVTVQFFIVGHQSMNAIFSIGSLRNAIQCVTLQSPVINNQVFENSPRQTLTVNLTSTQPRVSTTGMATVTVNDDDDPIIALQQSSYTFRESTPEIEESICVVLKGPSEGLAIPFIVTFSVQSGTAIADSDYTTSSSQQTRQFTMPDDVNTMKCITVRIVNDEIGDPDETFSVTVSVQSSRVSIRGDDTATVIIDDDDILPSPRSLMLNSKTSRSVTLSWDTPDLTSTDGSVVGYTVACNNSGSQDVSAPTTTIVVLDLLPYLTYECSIYARYIGNNVGGASSVVVQTLQEAPGSSPVAINSTKSTSSSITLSWGPPVLSYGIITHYTLYINFRNGLNTNFTSTRSMFIISPLSPYQTISVQVSASTSIGEGPRSEALDFISAEAIPGPVGNLTVLRINGSNSTLEVSWIQPADLNGVFSQYFITVIDDNGVLKEYNTTEESIIVTQLEPFIPYTISVVAENGAGRGVPQEIIEFTAEGVPVSYPTNVIIRRINATSAIVTWTHLSLSESRGFITNYIISYWEANSDLMNATIVLVSGEQNSTLITGLDPNSEYLFTVSASTIGGQGNTSDTIRLPRHDTAVTQVGVIAGIVAVLILAVAILIFIFICIACSKRKGKRESQVKKKPVPPPKPKRPCLELDDKGPEKEDIFKDDDDEADTQFLLPETGDISQEDILVTEFARHVRELHLETDQGFEDQYKSIKDGDHSWSDGVQPFNKLKKNRFINIFPFDYCRVKLESTGRAGSDYINASWLNGYKREDAYIAAQGPMPDTVSDFWRMIWEYKLPTIVMVTKLVEGGREKCEQYWPNKPDEFMNPGLNIIITLKETKLFADYEIRVLAIKNVSEPGSTPFLVTHCHYLGWPDHGVPEYATSLLRFLKRVRKSHPYSGPPLLVHCSAGVGRTGTFIVLDTMLQKINEERTVNVYQFVKELRERRCQMVQTMSQYVFIHDALDELITCGETEIAAQNLFIAINQLRSIRANKSLSGFEEQFQLLEQVSRKPSNRDRRNIDSIEVGDKNRNTNKIPYDAHRPKLTGSNYEQYINASFIDGYKHRRCFVATQAPLENTVVDLWKMIKKLESRTIVMLCNLQENGMETCSLYWPDVVGDERVCGKVIVTLLSEEVDEGIVKRRLELAPTVQITSSDTYVVTLFHHTDWNETGTQPSPTSVLHLNGLVLNSQISTGNKPIIVMCNDGCGRSGTFISVYSQINRFKVEAVVDIFQCVKAARIQRMDLVSTVEQYELIHEVMKQYMMSFDEYANFSTVL